VRSRSCATPRCRSTSRALACSSIPCRAIRGRWTRPNSPNDRRNQPVGSRIDLDADAIVVDAGTTRFVDGGPITPPRRCAVSDSADVPILVDQTDAIDHRLPTREGFRSTLAGGADRVAIPGGGETADLG